MYKTIIFCIVVFIFISIVMYIQTKENDFDKVCGYFQSLEKESNLYKMTNLDRADFILENINKNLKLSSNARAAWEAISYAVADQRYELYKSAAESVLKKKWQCDIMKKLAPITGEF